MNIQILWNIQILTNGSWKFKITNSNAVVSSYACKEETLTAVFQDYIRSWNKQNEESVGMIMDIYSLAMKNYISEKVKKKLRVFLLH